MHHLLIESGKDILGHATRTSVDHADRNDASFIFVPADAQSFPISEVQAGGVAHLSEPNLGIPPRRCLVQSVQFSALPLTIGVVLVSSVTG
jgi:hypothetical protein